MKFVHALQWQLAYHSETVVTADHEVCEVDVNKLISFSDERLFETALTCSNSEGIEHCESDNW